MKTISLLASIAALLLVASCSDTTAPQAQRWCPHNTVDTVGVAYKGDTVSVVFTFLEWYDCAKGWPGGALSDRQPRHE